MLASKIGNIVWYDSDDLGYSSWDGASSHSEVSADRRLVETFDLLSQETLESFHRTYQFGYQL